MTSEEGEREGREDWVTRTERTRRATEVNKLGQALTALRPDQLDRLALPERLREEIDVCQRLKPRNRGRQNRLIGQILRAEDHDAIRVELAALGASHRQGVQHEKVNEAWLDRMIEEGDAAIETLLEQHPEADRQQLRRLARTARRMEDAKKSQRARRELLRAIRAARSE